MNGPDDRDHVWRKRLTVVCTAPVDHCCFLDVPNESLTAEVRDFIAEYVHSVEQLEILCLLLENDPKDWSAEEVFRQVQSSERSVSKCLESFRKNGLINSPAPGRYRMAFERPEAFATVRELAKAYRERRVAVIQSIYERPHDTLQDFADAFKLRKDK
jgi:hypothetical protein